MLHSGITKEKRIISGITVILMLSVMMLSSLFIAVETNHACCGEDCPICSFVTVCENTLRQVGEGIAAAAFVVLFTLVLILSVSHPAFLIRQETPVSTKVRMNN